MSIELLWHHLYFAPKFKTKIRCRLFKSSENQKAQIGDHLIVGKKEGESNLSIRWFLDPRVECVWLFGA